MAPGTGPRGRRDLRCRAVPSGRTLAVKGDTFKQKSSAVEYRERDDGSLAETRILTDKFVPVIRAWDLTPDSATLGQVLTIH